MPEKLIGDPDRSIFSDRKLAAHEGDIQIVELLRCVGMGQVDGGGEKFRNSRIDVACRGKKIECCQFFQESLGVWDANGRSANRF